MSDVETALHWLRSTFLYIRIQKNPAYYALGSAKTLEEICVRAVDDLVANGIVEVDNNIYKSTGELKRHRGLFQPGADLHTLRSIRGSEWQLQDRSEFDSTYLALAPADDVQILSRSTNASINHDAAFES